MRNIVTGLDIGTSAIRVVVAEWKRGSQTPQVLALVKKNSKGLRRGYVVNAEEAAEAISECLREAEKATKLRLKQAFIGLSDVTLISKVADGSTAVARGDMEISDLDINRALDAAEATLTDKDNSEVIHRFPISFKLDSKKVIGRPEGLKGNKLEVRGAFITYSKQHLKDLTQVLEASGLRVSLEDFVASPLASSLVVLTKVQKTAGVVMVNIGSQTTATAIFEEGLPVSVQVFPIGSTDITNDIALGFKVNLEEAEQIKRGEMEPNGPSTGRPSTKKKLEEIIEARLLDIFQLVEGHLRKIGRSGLLPAGIVLSGGGASIGNIETVARDYFKLPARLADASLATTSKNQIKDSAWAVAYGLTYFYDQEISESSRRNPTLQTIKKFFKELLP